MLYGWKENSMLTNCLAACAHLTITVSEIQRDICEKNQSFYHTPLHSTPHLGGFPSEYRHPLWDGKTRMVSLPDGEKMSKIGCTVWPQCTRVTTNDQPTNDQRRHDTAYLNFLAHPVEPRELHTVYLKLYKPKF